MPGIENEFKADVYPSIRTAALALAEEIIITENTAQPYLLQTDLLQPADIPIIGNVDQSILQDIAKILQDHSISTQATETGNISVPSFMDKWPNGIIISVEANIEDTIAIRGPAPFSVQHGTLQISVHSNKEQRRVSASYFDKPWIENFAEFVNRTPEKNWILARSQSSCTSEAQARHEAIQDAVRQLQNRYLVEVGGQSIQFTESDLINGNFIIDRFAQSLQGSATPIWREAILIDASPNKTHEAARKIISATTATRKSWAGKGLSMLGMLGLICLVYGFLNLATRGYYIWALRILAIVLLAAGIVVVLTFI
jgi:hypothetical protein